MNEWIAALRLQETLGPYASRLLGALLIALAAALAARLVRRALERLVDRWRLAQRLAVPDAARTIGSLGVAGVWLLALPALLGSLGLDGLLTPVNAMLSRLLGFLPNLLGAVAVFGIGLLAAQVTRRLVVGLLTAAGSETWATRLGVASTLGERSLAGLVGSVLFGLLMLPIVIAALQPLALDALTQPIAQVFERIVGILPTLASAAVIVVLAALAGRALATLTTALAAGLGLNRLPAALGLPDRFRMGGRDASELAGTAVLIGVLALGIIQAAELLGLRALTQALQALGLVGAQLASGLVVLLAGAWIAAVVARGVRATDGPHAATLALAARVVILAFTVALGLRQAGLPAEIVAIAFAALIGAVAVAFAVAVGLGARPAAERLIDAAVARWQGSPPTPDPGPGPSVGTVVASAAAPAPPERLDGPHGT